MKVQKFIEVRLLKKRIIPFIDVVQYDTGVQLVFSLVDFDIPSGTSATLYVQKRSGKFVYQEKNITVSGNEITIDLENQALTEHGETKYQITLKNGTDTVTTFAGVLRIEKSLADASAVESKTVIRAFDEAVADHVAEFQTKAEQIVAACVATIPGDYTTMEAKVNELANAVKGNMSGVVVFADDVSPVAHNPVVKVHGKNLFDISKISTMTPSASAYVSEVGNAYIVVTTPEGYVSNGYCTISRPLKEFCPSLQVGKTYTLKATTESYSNNIYLPNVGKSWVFGQAMVMTEDVLNSSVTFYGLSAQHNQGVGKCTISNIQVEEGSVATEYEPYIDPSTVTAIRCDKNLIPLATFTVTPSSTTATVEDGVLTLNGYLAAHRIYAVGLVGKTLTISCSSTRSGEKGGGFSVEFRDTENNKVSGIYKQNELSPCFSFTVPENTYQLVVFFYASGSSSETGTAKYKNVQLELGDGATKYEHPAYSEYIPASDGTVSGLTSVFPNMTILTDTEGAIVECEYNRDTNKVIEKLTNAIIALGGTV